MRTSKTRGAPKALQVVSAPAQLVTNPAEVADYARQLLRDAEQGKVRGVVCFEDRSEEIAVVEVGSCSPLSTRMLMGMSRFVQRAILGLES